MDKITKDWWKAFFLVFPILSFWLHASYFYFSNVTYSFDFVTCLGVCYMEMLVIQKENYW